MSLGDANLYLGLMIRIDADPVVRAWTGIGPKRLAPDAVEVAGAVYRGVGLLREIPDLPLLMNGTADQVEIGLSGVDVKVAELADQDAADIEGCEVALGLAEFDARWKLKSPVRWNTDFVIEKIGTVENREGERGTASVYLTLGRGDSDRRRPRHGLWTPDQARPAQGPLAADTAFRHVPSLALGVTAAWPPPAK